MQSHIFYAAIHKRQMESCKATERSQCSQERQISCVVSGDVSRQHPADGKHRECNQVGQNGSRLFERIKRGDPVGPIESYQR